MAWRCGSLPRTLISTARSSSIRSSTSTSSLPRLRPSSPPLQANRLHSRRPLLSPPTRSIGALGCIQSLMPLHSVVAATRLTCHLSVEVRACCELSQGT
ncbi:Protein NUCLEAR FUSION DEFECTIVE 6 like [Melia azedarach]|uniref:Protein NUCLEAR FUSION DEFECTIVE 6 like n=1 Tax=Melia azedarach TaxID=155640 RepID=A0ACC1XV15_MELAZ|nr:Protein NUCLEAR FUSION DEFECTIVE 6 like [Melia azedarach]